MSLPDGLVDGLLIGRRHPAKVAMGDTFAVLAVPL